MLESKGIPFGASPAAIFPMGVSLSFPATYRLTANDWQWVKLGELIEALSAQISKMPEKDAKAIRLGLNLSPAGLVYAFASLAPRCGSFSHSEVANNLISGCYLTGEESEYAKWRLMAVAAPAGVTWNLVPAHLLDYARWDEGVFVASGWARDVHSAILRQKGIRALVKDRVQHIITAHGTCEEFRG